MSTFKPVKKGSWWISSKKNPKWDRNGSGFVGGVTMPGEVIATIGEMKKLYGKVPNDLEWGYMKD